MRRILVTNLFFVPAVANQADVPWILRQSFHLEMADVLSRTSLTNFGEALIPNAP